jgi:hypothetical protein
MSKSLSVENTGVTAVAVVIDVTHSVCVWSVMTAGAVNHVDSQMYLVS